MSAPLVLTDRVGPAAVLTLNRQEKRNALNRPLIAELHSRLIEATSDQQVRAVILAAAAAR